MGKLNYTGRKISGVKAGQVVQKDLRKRMPPGNGSKAAARDPHVELDLSGKELTDEGFAVFVDDLIECLRYRDEEHPQGIVRLTDVSLKGNILTTASMPKLGVVVALSADTLSRLNIADNDIQVKTQQQRDEWRAFLESFQGCYMLKRIDFAGNKLGGPGFDVLARVYAKSELDFIEPEREAHHNGNGSYENGISSALDGMHLGGEKQNGTADDGKLHYTSTRGLRSIPYWDLSETCTTAACGFHLWNLIMAHRSPEQLLEFLPAGKSVAPLDRGVETCGIIYSPNYGLDKLSWQLLELGMKIRQRTSDSAFSEREEEDDAEVIEIRKAERKAQVEMERVRNRLLLAVIGADGMNSVDLWRVAFTMMTVARAVLLKGGNIGFMAGLGGHHRNPDSIDVTDELEFPSLDVSARKNDLRNRAILRRGENRSSSSDASMSSGTPLSRVKSGDALAKITATGVEYTEPRRFGLPLDVWRRIIARAVDGSGILSEDQQLKVLQYASDRVSIQQELRIQGGTEYEQQWKILYSMDCLSYRK